MTRRDTAWGVLLAFYASARDAMAQQQTVATSGTIARSQDKFQTICRDGRGGVSLCDIQNNQCPVCGEMAEPYKRKTEMEAYGPSACFPVSSPGLMATTGCLRPSETNLNGPMERTTRCRRCNNAFVQDAEK